MDHQLKRIADNLDRIATSMEDSAAMAKKAIGVDPAQQFKDALKVMQESNPVLASAFAQVENMMLGKPPTGKGAIDASSSD